VSEYKRVLQAWALSTLPKDLDAVRVLKVDVDYYRGFGGSDVTPADDPELSIRVDYEDTSGEHRTYWPWGNEDNAKRLGELLQDLFRIAEADNDH
jgi:hypothetical protein